METSELDKAVEYTKQFIEAAMPVAKKAYEIGLMTLRIDAVQSLVFAVALLTFAILVGRKIRRDWVEAKRIAKSPDERGRGYNVDKPSSHLPADGFFHLIGTLAAASSFAISMIDILNIWLWVKLFAPELWLAHRAIEKLVG